MTSLYLLSQKINTGYDTYDSCVVCADSVEEAVKLHPKMQDKARYPDMVLDPTTDQWYNDDWDIVHYHPDSTWAYHPFQVSWQYLGEAHSTVELGVVCASFNAG